jgi:hypothetical protein
VDYSPTLDGLWISNLNLWALMHGNSSVKRKKDGPSSIQKLNVWALEAASHNFEILKPKCTEFNCEILLSRYNYSMHESQERMNYSDEKYLVDDLQPLNTFSVCFCTSSWKLGLTS